MPTPHAPPHFSSAGALGALHVGVALFGFAGLFGKWIPWDPVAIVLGRTAVAAVVLAFVVRYRRGRLAWPSARVLPNGLILAIHWIAFFAAIQESTVAIGLLGYASFPMFVPLLERAMLGIAIRRRELAKVALVVAGLLLLVPEWNWASHTVRGLAWGVLSGFTFALLTVRTRKLSPASRSSEMALWQNAVAALCVAPFVFAQGGTSGAVSAHALLLVAAARRVLHGARALAVHREPRAPAGHHRRHRGRARARLRHRARVVAAARGAGRAHAGGRAAARRGRRARDAWRAARFRQVTHVAACARIR